MAWSNCNAKSDVQPLSYDSVRDKTDRGSQHTILATRQAAQAINGCIERQFKGKKVSKATFTALTVKYDTRTMTLIDDDTVSLSAIENCVRCELALPDATDGYQRQYLDSDEWSGTESTLTARDGDYFLHIGFRRHKNETERNTAEDGTILGVDLGLENLAVTSTASLFSGRELPTTSASSRRSALNSNRLGREVPTGHSNSQVVVNYDTSGTFSTARQTW